MNDVKISGRIGNDLVLRFTADNTAVVNVSLAVERAGHKDDPDWIEVAVWGSSAQSLVEYCAKGDQIIVTDAHLRPGHVEVDGKKYSTVAVNANRIEFASTAARNRPVGGTGK